MCKQVACTAANAERLRSDGDYSFAAKNAEPYGTIIWASQTLIIILICLLGLLVSDRPLESS